MKKVYVFIALIFIIFLSLSVNAAEEQVTNELTDWWTNTVQPWIMTAVAGLTGSGIVGLLMGIFQSRLRKKVNSLIAEASTNLGLSTEASNELNKAASDLITTMEGQLNVKVTEIEKGVNDTINKVLDDKIAKLNITLEEVESSRAKLITLANAIIAELGVILDEDEE